MRTVYDDAFDRRRTALPAAAVALTSVSYIKHPLHILQSYARTYSFLPRVAHATHIARHMLWPGVLL